MEAVGVLVLTYAFHLELLSSQMEELSFIDCFLYVINFNYYYIMSLITC